MSTRSVLVVFQPNTWICVCTCVCMCACTCVCVYSRQTFYHKAFQHLDFNRHSINICWTLILQMKKLRCRGGESLVQSQGGVIEISTPQAESSFVLHPLFPSCVFWAGLLPFLVLTSHPGDSEQNEVGVQPWHFAGDPDFTHISQWLCVFGLCFHQEPHLSWPINAISVTRRCPAINNIFKQSQENIFSILCHAGKSSELVTIWWPCYIS
jgi:hypothetical protein